MTYFGYFVNQCMLAQAPAAVCSFEYGINQFPYLQFPDLSPFPILQSQPLQHYYQ